MTILGALLTNWIRITALILIGEYTNMESSLMDDHNTFGWYLYVPFMIFLFWFGGKLTAQTVTKPSTITYKNMSSCYKNIAIIGLVNLIFSTSFTYDFATLNNKEQIKQPELLPLIINYNDHFVIKKEDLELHKYYFSGKDLEGKPTQFGNNLIPQGWSVYESTIIDGWKVSYIKQAKNNAIVLSKYKIDNLTTASKAVFKVYRLKKALFNVSNTTLYWSMINNDSCINNCQSLLKNIIGKLN